MSGDVVLVSQSLADSGLDEGCLQMVGLVMVGCEGKPDWKLVDMLAALKKACREQYPDVDLVTAAKVSVTMRAVSLVGDGYRARPERTAVVGVKYPEGW